MRSKNVVPDIKTKYIRRVEKGWEYGYYMQSACFKQGVVPTREQALEINAMDDRPAAQPHGGWWK
jgi:hypothetical protein